MLRIRYDMTSCFTKVSLTWPVTWSRILVECVTYPCRYIVVIQSITSPHPQTWFDWRANKEKSGTNSLPEPKRWWKISDKTRLASERSEIWGRSQDAISGISTSFICCRRRVGEMVFLRIQLLSLYLCFRFLFSRPSWKLVISSVLSFRPAWF